MDGLSAVSVDPAELKQLMFEKRESHPRRGPIFGKAGAGYLRDQYGLSGPPLCLRRLSGSSPPFGRLGNRAEVRR